MRTRSLFVQMAVILAVAIPASAHAQEPGDDHPILSRFEGAIMHMQQESEYASTALPNGTVPRANYGTGGAGADAAKDVVLPLEGRTSWTSYRAPEGKTPLEIIRNYESALTDSGFEILFSCALQSECGPGIGRYLRNIVFPDGYWTRSPSTLRPSYVLRGDTRALLAHRNDENGVVHAFVYLDDGTPPPAIHQVVVEAAAMQTEQVRTGVRSAGELRGALATEGRVIVEGVLFEHDSADIRPESMAALEQMAVVLNDGQDIQVDIVGHTDNSGRFDYNRDLSSRRARAVMQALIDSFKVDPGKMQAHGVASLAPVASNRSDQGRAMNRRVEMVLRSGGAL